MKVVVGDHLGLLKEVDVTKKHIYAVGGAAAAIPGVNKRLGVRCLLAVKSHVLVARECGTLELLSRKEAAAVGGDALPRRPPTLRFSHPILGMALAEVDATVKKEDEASDEEEEELSALRVAFVLENAHYCELSLSHLLKYETPYETLPGNSPEARAGSKQKQTKITGPIIDWRLRLPTLDLSKIAVDEERPIKRDAEESEESEDSAESSNESSRGKRARVKMESGMSEDELLKILPKVIKLSISRTKAKKVKATDPKTITNATTGANDEDGDDDNTDEAAEDTTVKTEAEASDADEDEDANEAETTDDDGAETCEDDGAIKTESAVERTGEDGADTAGNGEAGAEEMAEGVLVSCAAYDPERKQVLVGGTEIPLTVFDVDTGKKVFQARETHNNLNLRVKIDIRLCGFFHRQPSPAPNQALDQAFDRTLGLEYFSIDSKGICRVYDGKLRKPATAFQTTIKKRCPSAVSLKSSTCSVSPPTTHLRRLAAAPRSTERSVATDTTVEACVDFYVADTKGGLNCVRLRTLTAFERRKETERAESLAHRELTPKQMRKRQVKIHETHHLSATAPTSKLATNGERGSRGNFRVSAEAGFATEIVGAVTAMAIADDQAVLGGLGRRLYVFEKKAGKWKQNHRIFLNNKLTTFVVRN